MAKRSRKKAPPQRLILDAGAAIAAGGDGSGCGVHRPVEDRHVGDGQSSVAVVLHQRNVTAWECAPSAGSGRVKSSDKRMIGAGLLESERHRLGRRRRTRHPVTRTMSLLAMNPFEVASTGPQSSPALET